jgi:hypothetical protein
VKSIRKFYKTIQIIVIEGSKAGNVSVFADINIRVRCHGFNVGHAEGLKLALKEVKTKYVLIFDSDIEMKSPCIETMLMQFKKDTYGVGQVVTVDKTGHNATQGIPYLHPHFCIVNREKYEQNASLLDCGAPFIDAMKCKIKIKHFDVSKYILHKERGTVNVIAREEAKAQAGKPERSYGIVKLVSGERNQK